MSKIVDAIFSEIDKNGDGNIQLEELEEFFKLKEAEKQKTIKVQQFAKERASVFVRGKGRPGERKSLFGA